MQNDYLIPPSSSRKVYTVSQINSLARAVLEDALPAAWVTGEISNLSQPGSGHIYFSLKDASAQIRCAMFRSCRNNLKFQPKNGDHVIVAGQVSIYEARGDYQLIVQSMELAGDGVLHEKFLRLKNKLAAEGLFDAKFKKELPDIPKRIGVITSPTGAAVHDILTVLRRRFPSTPVIIYPAKVQGSDAAMQIADAIKIANLRKECDVLIVGRGGGSLEDLWPFNEEVVARSIFASEIPIVTGIGHEIDFTIADFVADHRAPTPSAAAELITPDVEEYLSEIRHVLFRLNSFMQSQINYAKNHLINLKHRLQHPAQRLQQQAQRIDDLEQRMKIALLNLYEHKRAELRHYEAQLGQHIPSHQIEKNLHKVTFFSVRLRGAIQQKLQNYQNRLAQNAHALENLNPLAILKRGYAVATKGREIISDVRAVQKGDQISVKLANGQLLCIVEDVAAEH